MQVPRHDFLVRANPPQVENWLTYPKASGTYPRSTSTNLSALASLFHGFEEIVGQGKIHEQWTAAAGFGIVYLLLRGAS